MIPAKINLYFPKSEKYPPKLDPDEPEECGASPLC
jgi:hypothetical protein